MNQSIKAILTEYNRFSSVRLPLYVEGYGFSPLNHPNPSSYVLPILQTHKTQKGVTDGHIRQETI